MMTALVIRVCHLFLSSATQTSMEILHHVPSLTLSFQDFLCLHLFPSSNATQSITYRNIDNLKLYAAFLHKFMLISEGVWRRRRKKEGNIKKKKKIRKKKKKILSKTSFHLYIEQVEQTLANKEEFEYGSQYSETCQLLKTQAVRQGGYCCTLLWW